MQERSAHVVVKLRRLASGARPRVVDLFSGCGGLSLGFQRAGFEIVAGVERDRHAAASHARNFHAGASRHAVPRDLTDPLTTPATVLQDLGLPGPVAAVVDVVVAGPPCQAFARIGRAKLRALAEDPVAFLHDPRADLHEHWLAWIAELVPLAVLIENVPDMLNQARRNLAQEIAEELDQLGYVARYTLLNAVHYGVPQIRERLFIIALHHSIGREPTFPPPSHRHVLPAGYRHSRTVALRHVTHDLFSSASGWRDPPPVPADAPPAVTTRAALADLAPLCPASDPLARRGARRLDRAVPYRPVRPSGFAGSMRPWPGFEAPDGGPRDHVVRHLPRDWPIFARMRPGDEYPAAVAIAESLFAERLRTANADATRPDPASDAWRALRKATVPPYRADSFPNKWWKLDPDLPSRTLMAHLGKDSYSHIHYEDAQARPISVREAARLQPTGDLQDVQRGLAARLVARPAPTGTGVVGAVGDEWPATRC